LVNPRLLIAGALGALCLAGSGCFSVHLDRVAGRLVDARTGEGISGATLFRTYQVETFPISFPFFFGEQPGTGGTFTPDWVVSRVNGEFEFPKMRNPRFARVEQSPGIIWIHRDLGWGSEILTENENTRLVIEVEPQSDRIGYLHGTADVGIDSSCDNVRGDDAYDFCEELVSRLRGEGP